MGEMISFPVLKINVETLWSNEKDLEKEVFWGLQVHEIIPYPVWIIQFPVFEINKIKLLQRQNQAKLSKMILRVGLAMSDVRFIKLVWLDWG